MKFGKEFSLQMVTEWQDAYMDYEYLKTLLKDIKLFREKNRQSSFHSAGLKRDFSLYETFSGLTHFHRHGHSRDHHGQGQPIYPEVDIEEQSIMVNSVKRDGSESYATTFLRSGEQGGEYELVYFRRLDDEFNKVVSFYNCKVEEVMKEASDLNKQMDALIAFRIKVENPKLLFDSSRKINSLVTDVAASTSSSWAPFPSGSTDSGTIQKDVIEEVGSSRERTLEELNKYEEEKEDYDNKENTKVEFQNPKNTMMGMGPSPLEILNKVKLIPTLDTPSSAIQVILKSANLTQRKFGTENLKSVEQKLKRAFIEFYLKLHLLKNYCFLNTLAFSKIMKKYDKITSRNAAKSYMHMVDNYYLGSSDEVLKLMERVEDTFITHFANSNRSKGMNILRPKDKKERHSISFSTGFFAGCAAALIVALILIIRARNILQHEGRAEYMENMFPLYSLFGFIFLHMLMYAVDIYFWRRYRVNYSFIFGFKKGTELGYREVLLPSFGFAVLALASVILNLDMEMDPKTHDYKELTELLPLNLVILVFIILVCPFNIIYRSSRYFFLVCVFRSLCAPLYKVTLSDFFLADQMTSQVQAFRSLEFYICYYGWGDYSHRQNTCKSDHVFNTFYFIVAAIPYAIRFLQCLRRLFEEKNSVQGYNGMKYLLTVVAVCLRTAYILNKGMRWKVLAWTFSAIAAIFGTYWDLFYDWGLLQRNSKNKWLRDKLLIPHKSVYFVAMVLNVVLRFAWLETVLDFQVSSLHRETLITIVASLEIIRRGVWNFFRLENEHLNSVGHYRAFKSVPLPFNYHEGEEDEEQ